MAMNIYISGISGTAMGPLALMAHAAGINVTGSDLHAGAVTPELTKAGLEFSIGPQDGDFLRQQLTKAQAAGETIDWFIYTSAINQANQELPLAQEQGIKCSKRDEFIAFLVEHLQLKMIAVAGTHGKTTTTAGIIYLCRQLGLPISWLVGTTLGFAEAGAYVPGSSYLIYEADEYDRNFLAYHPYLSIIPSISYDHPDTYPTREEYQAAFDQFIGQSRTVITDTQLADQLKISGPSRRFDLALATEAVKHILDDYLALIGPSNSDFDQLSKLKLPDLLRSMDTFPGVGRRMEKLADGIYSDYAHHPEEIKATLAMAREEANLQHKKGVVAIYEPHQNLRQLEIFSDYHAAFLGVDKLFWLPTFLVRENPDLKVLTPDDFIASLDNLEVAEPAELNEALVLRLKHYLTQNYLILLMSAGPADTWLRDHLAP